MADKCQHGNLIDPPNNNCLWCLTTGLALAQVNHNEAWSLAHMKVNESNLARCYIEVRYLADLLVHDKATDAARQRLSEICKSNDL